MTEIALVVGLGNPGPRYVGSRHNMGFEVIDELARRCSVTSWLENCDSDLARIHCARALWLARPRTYMNLSGRAVECLLDALELSPLSMLVVVDDVDLPLSTLRLRRDGGPGTHNGLRDICERVGNGFPRLRLGVRGQQVWRDLADYVLSPFPEEERSAALATVVRAADAVEAVVAEGLDSAMERFNRRPASLP